MRWVYRVWQFFTRLAACPDPTQLDQARDLLPEAAFRLFSRMRRGDMVHALCVYRRLLGLGIEDLDLLQAALLHDVGKVEGRLSLARRSIIVLLEGFGRGLGDLATDPSPASWRYPFYVHVHHAEIGADLCHQAGCSDRVTRLVLYHKDSGSLAELPSGLDLLQAADDRC